MHVLGVTLAWIALALGGCCHLAGEPDFDEEHDHAAHDDDPVAAETDAGAEDGGGE